MAGAALGAVATTVAAHRLTASRSVRREALAALDAAGPYGTLRGTPGTVTADDGTELYYEIDEPGPAPRPAGDGAGGPVAAPLTVPAPRAAGSARPRRRAARRRPTVVFCHGYCLGQDVWHFQRAALRGAARAVYWDQRGHGRSGRGPVGGPVATGLLGRDLKAVLDATVPEGPVVLVGHSMGGMTVMALAEQFPDYVAERVAGIALIGTSAGRLAEVTYGLPASAARAVRVVLPGLLRTLGARQGLVDRGRRAAGELYSGVVRRYAFGRPDDVDPGVARFAERLLESVPVEVVAEFYPAFAEHDTTRALPVLAGLAADLPVLVMVGERDEVTPPAHSERIAAGLPHAEFARLPDAGHLLLLEAPDQVNERLGALLARSIPSHEPAV
ncbi:alpha/beta hydrolase [Streptomyces sp. RFCAC02]|uniref:alpha/beta fold hydrolase n=1 Tax=Streptomyces sp. RFCAC02 TaxID=2499143 RepID=UPI0010216099|nr:alpha/beta hydrolase [Streptomyces sp. RFCAC02]